jgi:hypothetical protein
MTIFEGSHSPGGGVDVVLYMSAMVFCSWRPFACVPSSFAPFNTNQVVHARQRRGLLLSQHPLFQLTLRRSGIRNAIAGGLMPLDWGLYGCDANDFSIWTNIGRSHPSSIFSRASQTSSGRELWTGCRWLLHVSRCRGGSVDGFPPL